MDIVDVNKDNIDQEHICCAISDKKVPFTLIKIDTKKKAQEAPSPFTTYSLFYNGKFVTNEILSESKFLKILES